MLRSDVPIAANDRHRSACRFDYALCRGQPYPLVDTVRHDANITIATDLRQEAGKYRRLMGLTRESRVMLKRAQHTTAVVDYRHPNNPS